MATLHPKDYTIVPHELRFGPKTHDRGVTFDKTTIRVLPDTTGTITGNSLTTFRLTAASQAIDPRSIQLHFLLGVTGFTDDLTLPDDGGMSMLRQITVRLGMGFQQDRQEYYNRIRNAIGLPTVPEQFKRSVFGYGQGYHRQQADESFYRRFLPVVAAPTTGSWNPTGLLTYPAPTTGLELAGSPMLSYQTANIAEYKGGTTAVPTTGGRWITIPLDLIGLFAQEKFIYLPATGDLIIEAIWEDPLQCVSRFTANSESYSYNIGTQNPIYLTYDSINLSAAYIGGLSQALTTTGISFDTIKYYAQKYSLPAMSGPRNFVMTKSFQSAKSIFAFWCENYSGADAALANQITTNRTSRFSCVNLAQFNVVIDGHGVTQFPIICGIKRQSEMLLELAKALRLSGDVSAAPGISVDSYYNKIAADKQAVTPTVAITAGNLSNQHMIVGLDLERTGAELSGKNFNQLEFQADFSNGANCDLYIVVMYDSRLIVQAGQRYTIIE